MKYRLATPGPAMVPPEVLLELAKPVRHHRTPEIKAAVAEVLGSLRQVFRTEHPTLLFTSSGTGAMEAAVANTLQPGDKAIVLSAGKWGERWIQLCKTFGANGVFVTVDYGQAIAPDLLATALAEHPDTVAVYTQLTDTSTGVCMDVEAMGALVAKTPALFVVDGISGVGADRLEMDAWNVDLLAVGSQKALMLPPGLAALGVSPKARARMESLPPAPSYYFNVLKYLKSAVDNDTPYTPAHTLIAALAVALRAVLAEGMEAVWQRHQLLASAMRAGVRAIGLELFSERPADSLTVLHGPAGIDVKQWAKLLETKYGLKAAGGQGTLDGKILRIAHMGYVDALDLVGFVAGLEWSLAELGWKLESGRGVAAATQVLASGLVTSRSFGPVSPS